MRYRAYDEVQAAAMDSKMYIQTEENMQKRKQV